VLLTEGCKGKLGKDKNIVQYTFLGNQGQRRTLNIYDGTHSKIFSPIRSLIPSFNKNSDAEIRQFLSVPSNAALIRRIFIGALPFYQGDYVNAAINDLPQESHLFGFNLKYRGFQLGYSEMYRADHSSLGRLPAFFGYQNPENMIGEKMQITSLNYSNTWDKFTFTSNLMYLRTRYNKNSSLATNYNNDGLSYLYQASDDIFGEVVVNYNLTKKWELTSGVSYKIASVLPTTRDLETPFPINDYVPFTNNKPTPHPIFGNFGINPQRVSNLGAFAQAYFSSNRWNIVLGWRFDSPSNYEAQSYQRFAIMYKTSPKTSIRLSSGYSFKAPALTTTYQSIGVVSRTLDTLTGQYGEPDGTINYQIIPSQSLNPEESGSADIGFRYALNSNTYLDASVFFIGVSDLIIAVRDSIDTKQYPLAAPGLVRSYRNSSLTQSVLAGLQVVARTKDLVPSIKLSTNFAYTFQVGVENLGDNRGELNQYREVPMHTLQWGIAFNPIEKLYLNFDNVAMTGWYRRYFAPDVDFSDLSEQFINGYYTLDFIARYNFNKNISAFFKAMNVFDVKYGGINTSGLDVDLRYTPQMGRNMQIGVSFKMQ
jgi:hemoglobin/transferrin/lactoferrin receptor protein